MAAEIARDEEAIDRPDDFHIGAPERAAPIDAREISPRTERAPAHRAIPCEREDAARFLRGHQILERTLRLRTLDVLPHLAAPFDAPPHAPAATASAICSKELLESWPELGRQRGAPDLGLRARGAAIVRAVGYATTERLGQCAATRRAARWAVARRAAVPLLTRTCALISRYSGARDTSSRWVAATRHSDLLCARSFP